MTAADVPLIVRRDTRTPCCDRRPRGIGDDRYVCRGCGTVYVSAARAVVDTFGAGTEVVTPKVGDDATTV